MNELNSLARRLGVPSAALRQSLTHYTFYEDKENPNSNSRYIFAGMFIFRGKVADVLYKLVPGLGTQLQHTLGNLLSNEKLVAIFDKLKLRQHTRAGEKFVIKSHKHIFTFGLLGCMATECNDDELLSRFISEHFIKLNEHVIFHKPKNKDYRSQVNELAKQLLGDVLITLTTQVEGTYKTTVTLKEGDELANAQSKSYRYSRAKALKIALRLMSERILIDFDKNSQYFNRLLEREELAKQRKIEARAKIDKAKKQQKTEREKERKLISEAKDKARKKAQIEAKERKKRKAELDAKKAGKASQPLSANKRRHLEDKKK